MRVSLLTPASAELMMNDNQHHHLTAGPADLRRSYTKLDLAVHNANSSRERNSYSRQTSQHHHHNQVPSVLLCIWC
jgi:hypothetical protein